jgi:hypothetical protein
MAGSLTPDLVSQILMPGEEARTSRMWFLSRLLGEQQGSPSKHQSPHLFPGQAYKLPESLCPTSNVISLPSLKPEQIVPGHEKDSSMFKIPGFIFLSFLYSILITMIKILLPMAARMY